MPSALPLCNSQTPDPGQGLKLDGKLFPLPGADPHTPGQVLRLSCPGAHTSCCIYVLLKVLLRLLSYEESECTETGVEAKPQRTCLAWQHCPELSPWLGIHKAHT